MNVRKWQKEQPGRFEIRIPRSRNSPIGKYRSQSHGCIASGFWSGSPPRGECVACAPARHSVPSGHREWQNTPVCENSKRIGRDSGRAVPKRNGKCLARNRPVGSDFPSAEKAVCCRHPMTTPVLTKEILSRRSSAVSEVDVAIQKVFARSERGRVKVPRSRKGGGKPCQLQIR